MERRLLESSHQSESSLGTRTDLVVDRDHALFVVPRSVRRQLLSPCGTEVILEGMAGRRHMTVMSNLRR